MVWVDVEGEKGMRQLFARLPLELLMKAAKWEQWLGLLERGRPERLVLHGLNPPPAVKRAPGLGAVQKVEWTSLANI